jgi:hypothetical protein
MDERCNFRAWRTRPDGTRVCWSHSRPNDPAETVHPNCVGFCDVVLDSTWLDDDHCVACGRPLNEFGQCEPRCWEPE